MTELTIEHFVYQLLLEWQTTKIPGIALDWLEEQGVAVPDKEVGWGQHRRQVSRNEWDRQDVLNFLVQQPTFDLGRLKQLAGYPSAAVQEDYSGLPVGDDPEEDFLVDSSYRTILTQDGRFTIDNRHHDTPVVEEFYPAHGVEFYLSSLQEFFTENRRTNIAYSIQLEIKFLYFLVTRQSSDSVFRSLGGWLHEYVDMAPLEDLPVPYQHDLRSLNLSRFVWAYIDAQCDLGADGEPIDDMGRIDPDSLRDLIECAQEFENEYGELFTGREFQAAYDLMFTQNGHGTGFRDRPGYWDDEMEIEFGEHTGTVMSILEEGAQATGSCYLLRGSNGSVFTGS